MELLKDERIDYVAGTNYKVIQSPSIFSYSIDAVLLARFVHVPIQRGTFLDLCTGNGIIPLVLATRSKGTMIGVDIQERVVEMATKTVALNDLQEKIQIVHADINEMPKEIAPHTFDVVTCNPPYFETVSENELNKNMSYAIARHEIYCTLEDVIRTCSRYVKQKGKVALVHRPERLTDIMTLMRKYRIEPKRLQFIYPKVGKEANIVLVEGIKDGSPGVRCLPPLVVYNETGQYTDEFCLAYEGREKDERTN